MYHLDLQVGGIVLVGSASLKAESFASMINHK